MILVDTIFHIGFENNNKKSVFFQGLTKIPNDLNNETSPESNIADDFWMTKLIEKLFYHHSTCGQQLPKLIVCHA